MRSLYRIVALLVYWTHCARLEHSSDYSTYPTDFFENHVPKFVNNRPMIGIVAMQVSGQKMMMEAPWVSGKDYFGSSFVKFVESAGGRAVPIKEDITNDDLAKLLRKLNGVIMPGGDADISDSGKDSLVPTDSLNLSIPLQFTKEAKGSRLFGKAPKGIIRSLKNLPITFNAHGNGFPAQSYFNDSKLMQIVRAISTNYDRNGTHFISTYEARHAPIFGLQWHPEKVLFVFNPVLAVDHTIHATLSAQYIANLFMTEARKSSNHFEDRKDEEKHLIMSHYPTYVGNITETPYEQIYIFDFDNKYKPDEEKSKAGGEDGDDEEKDKTNLVKRSSSPTKYTDIPAYASSIKPSDNRDETSENMNALAAGKITQQHT